MNGRRGGEQGMALLTVLLLVAVMGALTAAALESMNRSLRMTGNGRTAMQARYYALGAETLALQRLADMIDRGGDRLTLAGDWNGRTFVFPAGDETTIRARVSDGGNCFNLNSVADGGTPTTLRTRMHGVSQFVALMAGLGVPADNARAVAWSLADFVDSDASTSPAGGEDGVYARAPVPYRTANTMLAEASELRAVAGITPEIYDMIRPWVCALPTTEMSPININTLLPAQAPLLAMVLPGRLSLEQARALLASRPAGGWQTMSDFWQQPAVAALKRAPEEVGQPRLATRFFNLEIEVESEDYAAAETALLDVTRGRARIVQRRWTIDE